MLRGLRLTTSKDGSSPWVRMHMITRRLGGIPTGKNWVPAPGRINTGTEVRRFELAVESLVQTKKGAKGKKKNVIWVRASTEGFHPASTALEPGFPAGMFSAKVKFIAGLFIAKGPKDWQKDPAALVQSAVTIPSPEKEMLGLAPDLNVMGATQMSALTGVGKSFCITVRDIRPAQGFADFTDFEKRVTAHRSRLDAKFQQSIAEFKTAYDAKKFVIS